MMRRLVSIFVCLVILMGLAVGAGAKGPAKTPPGQAKKSVPAQTDITLLLSDAGLTAVDQTALFFLANQAGLHTNLDEIIAIWHLNLGGLEVAFRIGFPPVLLDGELLVWRHPPITHSPLPLARERYERRFTHPWGLEKIERKPGKYEYSYENKVTGVSEKIEIKSQKYSYYYRSKLIEERLELQLSADRYEYTYRNRLTGEEIRRSGKAQLIQWRQIPKYLPKSAQVSIKDPDPEISFKFVFNFIFD